MKRPRKVSFGYLYKFHRYTGLIAALFALLLTLTGIVLNHTDNLKLDSRYIESGLILDWYGIRPPDNIPAFDTGKHWVMQLESQVYFDRILALRHDAALQGAVETGDFAVIAFADSLALLSPRGEVIEQMRAGELFEGEISRLGLDADGRIFVQAGNRRFVSEDGVTAWNTTDLAPLDWAAAGKPPAEILDPIVHAYRSKVLPLERLLLDLHSGRLFGEFGVWLIDVAALMIGFLAISGSWIWLHHKRKSLRSRRRRTHA